MGQHFCDPPPFPCTRIPCPLVGCSAATIFPRLLRHVLHGRKNKRTWPQIKVQTLLQTICHKTECRNPAKAECRKREQRWPKLNHVASEGVGHLLAPPPFATTFAWSFEPWRHFADRRSEAHKFSFVLPRPRGKVSWRKAERLQFKRPAWHRFSSNFRLRLVWMLIAWTLPSRQQWPTKAFKIYDLQAMLPEMNEDKLQKWPRRWFYGHVGDANQLLKEKRKKRDTGIMDSNKKITI